MKWVVTKFVEFLTKKHSNNIAEEFLNETADVPKLPSASHQVIKRWYMAMKLKQMLNCPNELPEKPKKPYLIRSTVLTIFFYYNR